MKEVDGGNRSLVRLEFGDDDFDSDLTCVNTLIETTLQKRLVAHYVGSPWRDLGLLPAARREKAQEEPVRVTSKGANPRVNPSRQGQPAVAVSSSRGDNLDFERELNDWNFMEVQR